MKVTVELDWNAATETMRNGWLMFVPLPREYIEEIFPTLDTEQRMLCLTIQTIAPDLIDEWWRSFTANERMVVIQHQRLSQQLREDVWTVNPTWQEGIAWSQPLTMPFIERVWPDVISSVKRALLLKQDIPLKFIFERWPELSGDQKAAAWGIDIDPDPISGNKELHTAVKVFVEEMDKHIAMWTDKETIPKDTLPTLLASSNKFIRALATGRMDRDSGEEKEEEE